MFKGRKNSEQPLSQSEIIDNYVASLSKKEKENKVSHKSPRFIKRRKAIIATVISFLVVVLTAAILFATEVISIKSIKAFFEDSKAVIGFDIEKNNSDKDNQSLPDDNNLSDISTPNPNRPTKIFGTTLTVDKDFKTNDYDNVATLIDEISANGFTTVFVSIHNGEKLLYETEEGEKALSDIITLSHEKALSVFGVLDLSKVVTDDITVKENTAKINQVALELCATANLDGIMIEGLERTEKALDFKEYIAIGTLSGYKNYSQDRLTSFVKQLFSTLRANNGSMLLGIICDSVYATDKTLEGGMAVTTKNELLTHKNADVLKWMKESLFDIVFVRAETSTTSAALPFETVINWWHKNAPASCDLGFILSGDLAMKGEGDWSNPDQLTRQLMALNEINRYVFCIDGYTALRSDTTGAAALTFKYILGNVAEDYVLKNLTFTAPTKRSFTTYENKVSIIGASDPNFELTLNGEAVERTEYGYFSIELDLKAGKNTFKFAHKGTEETFTITYRYVIIKDYSPSSEVKMEGKSTLIVKATAREGSTVTSTLNGKTITLQPTEGEENSDFITYMGGFTLPAGQSKDKSIGKVTFTGSHNGITESFIGGKVTVLKKPEETSSSPSSSQKENSGNNNYIGVGNTLIAEVVKYEVETFDGDKVDDLSQPYNNYLPEGTVDYCSETTSYDPGSGNTYRLLRYGKRVYTTKGGVKNITTLRGTLPETNKLSVKSISTSGTHTVLTLKTDWKAPFTFELKNQKYYSATGSNRGSISEATFEYIDITFCYASELKGAVDNFKNSPIFKKAEVIKNTSDYTLRLYLKEKGEFYGWSASYNSDGNLVFKFLNPKKATKASNKYGGRLDGITIVVDAGHGGSDGGAVGSIAKYDEADRNLFLAKKLQTKLQSIGATVIMTRTGDTSMTSDTRIKKVKNASPNLAISVHRDSSTSASAKGFGAYYFNPYTKKVADCIKSSTAQTNSYSSTKVGWHVFYMSRISDCPVVLTENGFMSNSIDFNNMLNDDWNDKCADAIVQGVVDYFLSIE